MIVFQDVDQFSRDTGEKLGSKKVWLKTICDFTGRDVDEGQNPNSYRVNHNDNDPNFGDGVGEGWAYKLDPRPDVHSLFAQAEYTFITNWQGVEIFGLMIEAYKETGEEIYGLDTLLRWSRAQMIKKMLDEKKYELKDFLENDDMLSDDF